MADFTLPDLATGTTDEDILSLFPALATTSTKLNEATAAMRLALANPNFDEDTISKQYSGYELDTKNNETLQTDMAQAVSTEQFVGLVTSDPVAKEKKEVNLAEAALEAFSPLARQFDDNLPHTGFEEYTKAALNTLSVNDDQTVKLQIAASYIASMAHQLADEAEWDDYAAVFLAPDAWKDASDFTGSALSPQEALTKFRDWYLTLKPEDQVRYGPYLIKQLTDAYDGNKLDMANFLSGLLDPTKSMDVTADMLLELGPLGITLGMGAVKNIFKVARAANTVNVVDAVNPKAGAVLNQAAAEGSAQGVKAAGISQSVANANMTGAPFYDIAAEASKLGAADKVQRAIARQEAVTKQVEKVKELTDSLTFSALTPDEKSAAQTHAINKMTKDWEEKLQGTPYLVDKVIPMGGSPTGFTFKLELKDPTTGKGPHIVKEVKFTKYDVNGLANESIPELGNIRYYFLSPETDIEKAFGGWVTEGTRVLMQQARLGESIRDLYAKAWKGVPSKSKDKVNVLLQEGHEQGKMFDLSELLARGFTDEEIGAYYTNRQIFDFAHDMKNYETFRKLEFSGWAGTKLRVRQDGGAIVEDNVISREVKDLERHIEELNGSKQILDDTGAIPRIKELGYGSGYKEVKDLLDANPSLSLVRMYRPVQHLEGRSNWFTLAIVDRSKVTGLKKNPLNYVKGYVPRMREGARYVGYRIGDKAVNGVTNAEFKNVTHVFSNKTDAALWKQEMKEAGHNVDIDKSGRVQKILSKEEHDEIEYTAFGGLITGHRTSVDIKFTSKDLEAEFVPAAEAMRRNLNSIASNMPMNEFRLGMIARFVQTANTGSKKYLPSKNWLDEIPYDPTDGRGLFLRKTQEWMKELFHIPTNEERVWKAVMTKFAETLERISVTKGGDELAYLDGIRKWSFDLGNKNPYAALRAGAFHTLLGAFNPAQLIVQAQSAAVALSLDPLRAPKYIRDAMALRLAMNMRHNEQAIRMVGKAAGYRGDDFYDLFKDYERSGFHDSVRTNSDYEMAAAGGFISASAISRVADAGLLFFREGERFGRAYSYAAARAKYLRKNSLKNLDDGGRAGVDAETLRMTFNMTSANKARWQSGWTSVPLQFSQITFKFFENLVPDIIGGAASKTGKFSAGEKFSIFMMQTAMFGAAGVPFFEKYILPSVVQYAGITPDKIDSNWVSAIKGGSMELLASIAAGAPVEVGTRISLAGQLDELLDRMTGTDPWWKVALAASGAPIDRTFEAISFLADTEASFANPIHGASPEGARAALMTFANIASSSRNAMAAYMWHKTKKVYDRNGTLVVDLSQDPEAISLMAKAFGFSPAVLEDVAVAQRALVKTEQDYKDAITHLRKIEELKQTRLNELFTSGAEEAEIAKVVQWYDGAKGIVYDGFDGMDRLYLVKRYAKNAQRNRVSKVTDLRRRNIEMRLRGLDGGEGILYEGRLNFNKLEELNEIED